MTDGLSERARAILDAADRLALDPAGAVASPSLSPPSPAPDPETARLLGAAAHALQLAQTACRRIDEVEAALAEVLRCVEHAVAAARPPLAVATAATPPPPAAAPPPAPSGPPHGRAAAARLLAIELAVSGATRTEVDHRLRAELRLGETAALLDDLFGVGSAPGARLPWGAAAAPA